MWGRVTEQAIEIANEEIENEKERKK